MAEPSQEGADATVTAEAAAPAAALSVVSAGSTAVGQVREHNEDNFVVANLTTDELRPRDQNSNDDVGDGGMMFAVCDGMGGAAAGEVASQMAIDILVEAMRRGGPPQSRDGLARRLVQAVEEAGRRIFEAAQKERSRRGMGTTATVAVLADKVLFLAEVGDSRAYLLRGGKLKQLTKDQSLVNQLIEAGHLTEDEAEAFEHSNIILQALGTSETVQVDLTFVELRRGDRLMLCSDGLSGLVHADTMRSALEEISDPSEACARLIDYAEGGGGHDNITVIVADFDGEALTEPRDGDNFGYVQYPLPLEDEDASAFVEETTAGGRPPPAHDGDGGEDVDTVAPPARAGASTSAQPSPAESRASMLWIAAGILAIAAGIAVWVTLERERPPTASEDETIEPIQAPEEPAPEEAKAVLVNVHSDVAGATLLVNGESEGILDAESGRSLQLKPGAYRFEAQADGTSVAVTVVTVRGDLPMDVFLKRTEEPHDGQDRPGGQDGPAAPQDEQTAEGPDARDEGDEGAAADEPQLAEDGEGGAQVAPGAQEGGAARPPGSGGVAKLDPAAAERRAQARRERRERQRAEREARAAEQPQAKAGVESSAEPAAAVVPPPQEIPDNPF